MFYKLIAKTDKFRYNVWNEEERKGRYHIMDFRQLEAFIATVDHQSFSAAAEALYLSQPMCYTDSTR